MKAAPNNSIFPLLQKDKVKRFIQLLEKNTSMVFDNEESSSVCYARRENLRDDYKVSFKLSDLEAYFLPHKIDATTIDVAELPIPEDASAFWVAVRKQTSRLDAQ
jgi:hypothetical protein